MNPQMQIYRQYPQQAQGRAPASRRPGQIAPAQHSHQQAQAQLVSQQMQQRNAAIEHQLAQRRARKPTDRNMPEGIDDLVIGEGVKQYKELREMEKKLDHAMARKRLEIQDSFSRNIKRQRTMRIWISNTASNQLWQVSPDENSFTFEREGEPTYQVKVEGRLLEDPEDDILYESDDEDAKPTEASSSQQPFKRFSHFFKAISVEFDKTHSASGDPNYQVSWKKQANSGELDHFRFQRRSDENLNVSILLTRDEQPERFRLSQALAATLDMEEADRAEVVMGIWEYVKAMGLQEDDERRTIRCDERLRQIFNSDTLFFPQAAERLVPHLHPLPPVRLPYTIRVDEAFQSNPEPTVYDIQVTVEDPLRALILKMTQNPEHQATLRQIVRTDDELAILVQAIQHHKARHTFFTSLAKDPKRFMERWMSSQKKDLSVLLAEAERGDVAGMEYAQSGDTGSWSADLVNEAVRYRLARAEAIR
ncbi:hypothetical protein PV10_02830 [Exophiala mesophila]|uniref:DM2 domain-containing protein n=1 Tax=Exophiala mesophila TaxID=212818 RepID=A0A0D2A850_EXOME|nr:uncharacterized protein PV10_02830 [Exophiala mesophila]KIV95148.1 hypothetical protein PV10_02830 [Exophiala mesophila]